MTGGAGDFALVQSLRRRVFHSHVVNRAVEADGDDENRGWQTVEGSQRVPTVLTALVHDWPVAASFVHLEVPQKLFQISWREPSTHFVLQIEADFAAGRLFDPLVKAVEGLVARSTFPAHEAAVGAVRHVLHAAVVQLQRLDELCRVAGVILGGGSAFVVTSVAVGRFPQVLGVSDQAGDDVHAVLVEELVRAQNAVVVRIESRQKFVVEFHRQSIGEERKIIGAHDERIRRVQCVIHEVRMAFVHHLEDSIAVDFGVVRIVAEFAEIGRIIRMKLNFLHDHHQLTRLWIW